MTGAVQIYTIGTALQTFYLYSDINGFTAPFASGVTRDELLIGYATDQIPNSTAVIRVMSVDVPGKYLDISTSPVV
jgi:hypothetical protein